MRNLADIIVRPLVTEKGSILRMNNSYVFSVLIGTNKIEIKTAVEKLFNVKVEKINTINVKPKIRRLGRSIGRTSNWKKAYVKLKKDQKIDLIERMA